MLPKGNMFILVNTGHFSPEKLGKLKMNDSSIILQLTHAVLCFQIMVLASYHRNKQAKLITDSYFPNETE
jgi:hypothetical protein